jgi:hypothetical protein
MSIATDYRDSRKSAYQQYSVVSDFNACKLPEHFTGIDAAPLGVAFVAAALGLGICLGVDFAAINGRPRGPDLLRTVRALARDSLPEDIRKTCFDGIREDERPKQGDWIAIWGGEFKSSFRLRKYKLTDLSRVFCLWLLRNSDSQTSWPKSYCRY